MAISSLSPPAGPVSGTVVISGSGFGASQSLGSGQVTFNGVAAGIVSWSDTGITVKVPTNASSGPVTVARYNGASNGAPFTVEGSATVDNISPAVAPAGSTIIITGSGFGATQSNSLVTFYGGSTAEIVSWSDTQIVAKVPFAASTGGVGVWVGGVSGSHFTVIISATAQVTDSLGHSSSYTAEMLGGGWLVTETTGSGCSTCTIRGVIHNNYDITTGNLLSHTDELGHGTSYTYDASNNLASTSTQLDANTTVQTSYTYNSFGEPLTVIDPLGNTTTNAYDANGNLTSVTAPKPDANTPASVTSFIYDPKGQLTTITDPLNHVTTLGYYPTGLIYTITDQQQNVTTYEYDLRGNRTAVVDALQNRTTFTYDMGNRLTKITYPDTTLVSFTYDSRGRRTSVTDQNGKTTTYAYDDADRLSSVTDAALNKTSYAYDTENNLLSITDAAGHITSFDYAPFGRVTQTAFPSGLAESYVYDAIGNLTSKTDRKGQQIIYLYDALNRLTHKGYPDATSIDYAYDLVGKIKQVTDLPPFSAR
jgi:YD repeat-containing protein